MEPIPFKKLLWTTAKYTNILAANGVSNLKELMLMFPRTYEDRKEIKTLSTLSPDGSLQTVKGYITKKSMFTSPRGKKISQVHFIDENERAGVINSFRGTYVLRSVKANKRYYIIGKPDLQYEKISFNHPEMIEATETDTDSYNFGRIYPIYSELLGIKPARFARKIFGVLDAWVAEFDEYLPQEFLDQYDLCGIKETIRNLHFPENLEQARQAKNRIFFEKLLNIQLVSLDHQASYQQSLPSPATINRDHIKTFISTLPFELTWAQKRAIKECLEDISNWRTMMRLLQWDVGSGKTVVAAAVAYHIIKEEWAQTAFLAPLSVLATQHHQSLAKLLLPLGVRIELLTWALPAKRKAELKAALAAWRIDMIVGTHAIIQDDIEFANLNFAIVDEQHKFWVRQRGFFQRFDSPHILQMTATPIPRSLTLAFFGEFEVSIIDEMPAGRKDIITKIVSNSEIKKLKPRIMTKIGQGQQCFVVTPLIDESEAEGMEEIASVKKEREEISAMYPELHGKIWLLHGKLKPAEKDQIMADFKNKKYTILVSTTVIEVWVDIPNATIMIIKNSERFGLSQLHQLRGRVWRSDIQSYAFLHTKRKSWDTYERLKHMEATNDGFKLAEIDLRIRGTWEILGVRQSWDSDIPIEILTDTSYLSKIKEAGNWLMEKHPDVVKYLLKKNELGGVGKNLV